VLKVTPQVAIPGAESALFKVQVACDHPTSVLLCILVLNYAILKLYWLNFLKCKESYLFSKGKETEGMGKRLK